MNELLLRRRVAASKGLPYDAEIEYLETQGECSIDTGVVVQGSNISIQTKFMYNGYTDNTEYLYWYQAYSEETKQAFRVIRQGTRNDYVLAYNGQQANGIRPSFRVTSGTIYEISTSGLSITLNGTTKESGTYKNVLNTGSLRIFSGKFIGRCYYMRVFDGQSLLLDCIPVRKGTTGYMYDKISSKLFGNAGTGSFILGPDV